MSIHTLMPSAKGPGWFLCLLPALLCGALPAAAQEQGGVVVTVMNRETSQPLPDVSVRVQGTNIGGLTDSNGRSLLQNVPAGRRVIVTERLGFGSENTAISVTAGGTASVTVQLIPRAIPLEGVVVTGTAIAAQRRELGNSIAVLTADQIQKVGAQNFEDILRSHATGVSVTGSPGQAGAGSQVLLRGVNSVNGRNQPLFYLDGVRMPTGLPEGSTGDAEEHASFLGGINPADIERIEIIKGPAASTLYGTEAGAGVIQIFTKKGQQGPPRWTFSAKHGVSRIGHVGPELDPTGLHVNDCRRKLAFDSTMLAFSVRNEPEPGCPASGSWLRDAHVQDYLLSATGGASNVTYYVSSGWSKAQGVIAPQHADLLTLRGNFMFTGLRNLSITVNNMYSRRDMLWIPNGDNVEGLLYNVARGDQGETPDNNDALVLDKELDQFINHFNSGANISWTPSGSLRHRINVGLDYSNSHYITERPWQFWNQPEGSRSTDIENQRVLTVDYAGSWHTRLPIGGDFTTTLSWGGQYNQSEHLGLRGDANVFLGPGDKVLQNGQEFTNQEDRDILESGGFFLQTLLGWKNRLFVTAGLRADTHSAFGSDYRLRQRFTTYPKLQAAYTLSDHAFWPDWWETFRIRSAYGEAGDAPRAQDPVTYFQVAGSDDNKLGFIIQNQGNPEIGPERSKEIEYGLDGSLFDGRLSYTFTGYQRKTVDGRIFINPPPSNGIAETLPMNVGEWKSRGFEASLDAVVYDVERARVDLHGGYQYNKTVMVDLGSPEFDSFNYNYLNQFREGYPIPSLFGNKVINADSVGQLPIYTTDGGHWFGSTRPLHEISLGASVTLLQRLTLDAFGIGQYGHVLYDDLAQEMTEDGLWPECYRVNTLVERFQAGETGALAGVKTNDIAHCSQDYATNEDWVEDADYFRLQSASVSYRLPERWLPLGFSAATLQLQATNLFTITGFSGIYPDALIRPLEQVARGSGYILPPATTYSLNLRVNF